MIKKNSKLLKYKQRVILYFNIIFVITLVFISSCEIDQPSAPNWLVDANIPITDKYHSIMQILEDDSNIYYDSLDNAIFSNQSNSSQKFQKDIRLNGQPNTQINIPTQVNDTNLFVQFDDSSFITQAEFEVSDPQGLLTINFNPAPSSVPYTITLTIDNLFDISSGNPFSITRNISDIPVIELISLASFRFFNSTPTNLFAFRVTTSSTQQLPASFTYSVTNVILKSATGIIKPVNLGVRDTLLLKPFGDYDIEGGLFNFSRVHEEKTYLVVKRTKSTYQVDIKNIQLEGFNLNGRPKKLKYLRYDTIGAPPQPIDSVFNLRIPQGVDSAVYFVNTTNSNVLEFINNLPQNVFLTRNTVINSNYNQGQIDNSDSISIYVSIEVPLHFSVVEPPTISDTIFKRIIDTAAREKLENTKNVDATLYLTNGLPFYSTVTMFVLDTNGSILFSLIDVVTPYPGDSIYIPPAPVDQNGYVLAPVINRYDGVIDSTNVLKLLDMHKIVYKYKLYTDPNIPPTVDGRVRVRGSDFLRHLSYGTFRYMINNN